MPMNQTPTVPTPEEIEAARLMVSQADAAAAEARKSANRAKLSPLLDLGLGGAGPLTCSANDLAACLRANAMALADMDATLPNLAFSTAQVLETMSDRIRSLAAQNAAAPEV